MGLMEVINWFKFWQTIFQSSTIIYFEFIAYILVWIFKSFYVAKAWTRNMPAFYLLAQYMSGLALVLLNVWLSLFCC